MGRVRVIWLGLGNMVRVREYLTLGLGLGNSSLMTLFQDKISSTAC